MFDRKIKSNSSCNCNSLTDKSCFGCWKCRPAASLHAYFKIPIPRTGRCFRPINMLSSITAVIIITLISFSFISKVAAVALSPSRIALEYDDELSSIPYESESIEFIRSMHQNQDQHQLQQQQQKNIPLIKKCCPFNQHFELQENGEGQCVPNDSHITNKLMVTSEENNGGRIWQIEWPAIMGDDYLSSVTEEILDSPSNSTDFIDNEMNSTETGNNNTTNNVLVQKGNDSLQHQPSNGNVQFRIDIGRPTCSLVNMQRKIIHKTHLTFYETSDILFGDDLNNSTRLNSNITILNPDGSLIWIDRKGLINTRGPEDFCIDQLNDENYIALICKPTCNDLNPCIRKCCLPSQVLDLENHMCVEAITPWMPYLYTMSFNPVQPPPIINNSSDENEFKLHWSKNFQFTNGLPGCEDYYLSSLREDPEDKFYALVNGSLLTVGRGYKVLHPPDTFCIDGTINHNVGGEFPIPGPDYEPIHYSGSELDQVAIICYPEQDSFGSTIVTAELSDWKFTTIAVVEFITVFFLFLTSLSYIILWEQQNIHGWLQFAYVVSLLQSFLCLAIIQVSHQRIRDSSPQICEAMGSVIHFSFLSAFFWLTCMNFDLWFTFSGCSSLRPSSKVGEIKRFCLFALFSWGSSGLIAGTGLVLDRLYKDRPNSSIIRPHFGEDSCYFAGHKEQLPYFYAPMGLLLIANLLFFFSTIYSLHKLQKDTKFATQQSSKQEKKRFLLFVKLFVVMGVLWVFEVVSWSVLISNPDSEVLHYVFLPTDILNASQGILIFIIFTCKANTCRQIEGQLKKFTLFVQENRDKGFGTGKWDHFKGFFVITFASITLPIIHLVRIILNYFGRLCGRKTLNDISGRRTLSNTTTVTSSTFDKSRKASDCSVVTTVSSITGGGGGGFSGTGGSGKGGGGGRSSGASSNNSSITNIEMDYTSSVSLKT